MDRELIAYLDERFGRIDERFDRMEERLTQAEQQIGGLREELHQTRILMEHQSNNTRQLAEGIIGTNERLDSFKDEMSLQFEHVRGLINPPYSDLNRRLKILESWRERSERDPVELVRERFGTPKGST